MEPKKSKKADLERSITFNFALGLVIALSLTLIAFEWVSETGNSGLLDINQGFRPIDEDIINTYTKPPEKPVAPPPVPEFIKIFSDEVELDVDVFFPTDITSENQEIKPYIPVITDEPDYIEEEYIIASEMPSFMGGELDQFSKWAQKQVKYPAIAAENNVSGKVYVTFVVEKDGTLSNISVMKGADEALDREALRVIKSSPLWNPGKNNGIPVRVRCSIMINFVLEGQRS